MPASLAVQEARRQERLQKERIAKNWEEKTEFEDGSGDKYYQTRCQFSRERRYVLCLMPSKNLLWFWNVVYESAETTRMHCYSWDKAEMVKRMLTTE